MKRLLVVLFIAALVAAFVYWRRTSMRTHPIPCPPWLSVLLENPFMERIAGSRTVFTRMGLAPGMKLLDVGCGPGRVTVPAAQVVGESGEVVGLDVQPEMLRRAQAKVDAAGLHNVHFIQAGAGEGKAGANVFDRAMLITVLGEIPDREAALREIHTALKPGGVLSVTEVLLDPHYQPRDAVRRMAESVGFREQAYFGSPLVYTLNLEKPAV